MQLEKPLRRASDPQRLEHIKAKWIDFLIFVSMLSSSPKALGTLPAGILITTRIRPLAAFDF